MWKMPPHRPSISPAQILQTDDPQTEIGELEKFNVTECDDNNQIWKKCQFVISMNEMMI